MRVCHCVRLTTSTAVAELPEPLISNSLRDAVEHALGSLDGEPLLAAVRQAIRASAQPARSTLCALLRFLSRVAAHSEQASGSNLNIVSNSHCVCRQTKMGASNLAVVFGPNLFVPRADTMYSRDERTLEYFIEHASGVFGCVYVSECLIMRVFSVGDSC